MTAFVFFIFKSAGKREGHMNLMLNMKDINRILAKTHFKCKKKLKKNPTFL
jgi:hypothetical protein